MGIKPCIIIQLHLACHLLNILHPVNHKSHIRANCKAENSSIPLWDDKLYGRDLIGSWILTSHQPHQVIQWERFVRRTKSKDEGTNKAEKITVFNTHFMSYSRARESIRRYQKFQQLPPCHILVVFQVLKRLENPWQFWEPLHSKMTDPVSRQIKMGQHRFTIPQNT